MTSIRVLAVCFVVFVTLAAPVDGSSTPIPSTNSTTPIPDIASTNISESTTTHPPASQNGTAPPSTTTAVPVPSTSETSSSISTTTAAAETTTPPSILFPDNIGKWNIKGSKGTDCIEFTGAIQLEYHHPNSHKTENLDVPKNATASGTCEEPTQTLTITWPHNETTNNTFLFTFTKASDNKTVSTSLNGTITSISFTVQNIFNPNTPVPGEFFKCNAKLAFLGDNNTTLRVAALKFTSFNTANTTSEKIPEVECPEDDQSMSGWTIFAYVCLTIFLVLLVSVIALGVVYYWRNLRNSSYASM